jgi:uncharacterized integral membrane protein (TIGR00697 family)
VDRKQVLYLWLGGLFVTALVVGDLIGGRFFRVGSIDLSSGMLLFPLTFVLTDVINEFYGAKGARRITFLGLGTATFTFLVVSLVMALPPSKLGTDPTTVAKVLGTSQRLFIASLSAYFLGQLSDIAIFGVFRRITGHRLIWLRATGSTLLSQALDTMVVTFGLLAGKESVEAIFRIVMHSYLLKVAIAIGLTPLIYAAHALIIRGLKVNETPQTS